VLATVLAGCDTGGTNEPTSTVAVGAGAAPPAATAKPNTIHGHFRGTAIGRDQTYHAEALLTVDGEIRLYVGGPGSVAFIEGHERRYSTNPIARGVTPQKIGARHRFFRDGDE
jgi:hypothetical protein